MLKIPKFTSRRVAYEVLTEEERWEVIILAEPISGEALREMPTLPPGLPYLACIMRRADTHPMMIVCETWADVNTLQLNAEFNDAQSINWVAIGNCSFDF